MTTTENSPLYVQSFATGISVLNAFGPSQSSMSLPEIAASAGITRSAAQRFAYTLEALGLLNKDPVTKRYSLSSHTLDVGCRFLDAHPVLARANPYLLDLCRETGETVNLAEPSGLDMVYIGRFQSPKRLFVHMPIGRRLPMYCSSSGRMYLSQLAETEARALLEASDRVKYTPNTVVEIDDLMADLSKTRERGFANCNGEYYRDDFALSVPVYDAAHRVAACLQISVSAARWRADRAIERFIPLMVDAAGLISTTPPSVRAQAPFAATPRATVSL